MHLPSSLRSACRHIGPVTATVAIMSTSEADPASRKSGQCNGQPVREPGPAGAVPIKGIDARLVANMTASLGIPSATSFRAIPVEILVALARPLNPAPTTTTRGGIVRCEPDDGVGELVRRLETLRVEAYVLPGDSPTESGSSTTLSYT